MLEDLCRVDAAAVVGDLEEHQRVVAWVMGEPDVHPAGVGVPLTVEHDPGHPGHPGHPAALDLFALGTVLAEALTGAPFADRAPLPATALSDLVHQLLAD